MGNLQPRVTQTLLPGARKVYGQLLSRDFNPQEKQPGTAYGQVHCFMTFLTNRSTSLLKLVSPF